MIADIAIAIILICIPGMVHVMFPERMAHLYEKSYRERLESLGRQPGRTTLRPGFVRFFGFVWIAVGVWILVNALFLILE
jgi:hypothetical protein